MGWIEGTGGLAKLLGFVVITFIMFYLAGKGVSRITNMLGQLANIPFIQSR